MKKGKRVKWLSLIFITVLIAMLLVACQGGKSSESSNPASNSNSGVSQGENGKPAREKLTFGVAPGPYGDMISQAIKPQLEEKGYKVEIREFSDYVQPNLALARGDLDANMFQHGVYLENFSKDHNLELTPLVRIPTAAVGLYSNKVNSVDELEDGAEITLANDATNLARALKFMENNGLLKINPDISATQASEKDIIENPKNFKITPIEAAQLPRSLDSVDASAVNGNFAIAAGIPLSTALAMEQLSEEHKNLIAIRTEDANEQFAKDIAEIVASEQFKNVIEGSDMFRYFQKPDWYIEQWGE